MLEPIRKRIDPVPESIFRIEVRVARIVDERKEQIPKLLVLPLGPLVRRHGLPELLQFFLHFAPGLIAVRKLEAHACGFFLHPLGAEKRRELGRHAVEHRGVVLVLLLLLDLFPRSRHLVRIVGGYLPKDVRVAPHELVGFRLNDVCECKSSLLFRNGGVEEHVQKDIAELLR